MNNENPDLKKIVFNMLKSAAPEQKNELIEMWNKYSPEFICSDDKDDFVLDVVFGVVRFTDKTLRLIWMFGHVTWKSLYLYSSIIHTRQRNKVLFNVEDIESELEQRSSLEEISSLLSMLHKLRSDGLEDCEWPSEIPLPAHNRPTNNDEHAAIYDLIGMAMVYMFLHEVRHIQFKVDLNAPCSEIEEELLCDRYARSFLFEDVKSHSQKTGYDLLKVTSKRAMAVALASFLIIELTPKNKWQESDTHPSINERFEYLMDYPDPQENDHYWLYLGSMLITKLRLMKVEIPIIQFRTEREFCEKVFVTFNRLSRNYS